MRVTKLLIASGLGVAGLVGLAMAADAPLPAKLGLTVSPPSLEMSANPGDVLQESIRITNESAQSLTLEIDAQDFTVNGTEGSVTLTADQDPNAFSKWIKFTQKQVQVKSKETATVPIRIEVPQTAEPGGHFASVLFNPKATAGSPGGQIGARVIQRVGALILLRVSGAVVENGSIDKVKTKTFVGAWDEVTASDGRTKILVAKDEKLQAERAHKWFSQGPVAFDVTFKNAGNVHFKPTGTLTVYNIFGHKVETLALDPRNVFPGGERRITVIWPQKSLWNFYYRANVTALYGSQNKILTAETKFIGFPVVVFIVIVVFLILLFLVRRRLGRAIGVLIRGK